MSIYLQGLSALAYYRNNGTANEVERSSAAVRSLADATSSRAEIVDAGIWRLGIGEPSEEHPLEVLLRDNRQRTRSRAVRARVWAGPVSPTAFRTARKNIYVSSPEFVFLQMATRLELPELIALGMELCGTYRSNVELSHVDSAETSSSTLYQQPPLSSIKRLQGFLDTTRTAPGHAKALKALSYVLPGSASPMETALYLLLCLPRRLGGYALPKPVLNPPIVISKSGRRHTLRYSAKPDLYWKSARLDLEYNSNEFHKENQRAVDSMRRKALERMKVEVIELTTDELLSVDLFHATAMRIARRLNKRIRSEREGGFAEKRSTLRDMLLADNTNPDTVETRTSAVPDVTISDGDGWFDEIPADDQWFDGALNDDLWDVELSDWSDEDVYVFGAGKRNAE